MGVREQLRQTSFHELGKHIIVDIRIKDSSKLTDLKFLKEILYKSAKKANLKILGENYVKFENTGGISLLLFIAESHISIHTWPEYGYAAIDIFTCGENSNPWLVYEYLIKILEPYEIQLKEIKRGFKI